VIFLCYLFHGYLLNPPRYRYSSFRYFYSEFGITDILRIVEIFMSINTHRQGHRCTLEIEQEMSIYTVAALKEPLLEPLSNSRELALDLSSVSELDTSGVQLLLLLHREAIRRQVALRIVGMSNSVREALSLYGLLSWFGTIDVLPPEGVRP
jgi:anti-anti-sigma factor